MKILIVGAGSIGGYFGGRLLEGGRDVTFLVRPQRAERLAAKGLIIRSPAGDLTIEDPPTITADRIADGYDLVILSCKVYDLDNAINDFAPAVGPTTRVLPLLNGMRHMDVLSARFGNATVLGGLCMIATSLNAEGEIEHKGDLQSLTFGAREPVNEDFADTLEAVLGGGGFDVHKSPRIQQEMWEKWVFIATAAGLTSMMRGPIGDIVEAGGAGIATTLLGACAAIARTAGFSPRAEAMDRFRSMFTTPGSPLTASMFRDLEKGGNVEADHLIGDLLNREIEPDTRTMALRIAYVHLKTYEARKRREAREREESESDANAFPSSAR